MSIFNKKKTTENFDWVEEEEKVPFLREAAEFVIEIIKVIIISLAIIIPIRYFLIQPFYVKGASMEPNFYDHEYLIIDEISYRFDEPQRGDIVVFRYPLDPSQYFIKRVIGLPGEKVEIKEGKVYIYNPEHPEGLAVDERLYLELSVETESHGNQAFVLDQDEYFVLGDNRVFSRDSRVFGPIHKSFITGRVWIRGWPFSRLTLFENPGYNL